MNEHQAAKCGINLTTGLYIQKININMKNIVAYRNVHNKPSYEFPTFASFTILQHAQKDWNCVPMLFFTSVICRFS